MPERPQVLLLVGDDTDSAIADAITDAGFETRTVSGLSAAIDALSERPADCIVSVGGVKSDDGTGATGIIEVVRATREVQADVPFVLYADANEEAVAKGVVGAGIADLVRQVHDEGYDRLIGRIRNAVARRQAVRRAEQQANLNEVIREINQALVRADSPEEIEQSICEELARSEQYNFAWIAHVGDDGELSLGAMGVDGGAVEGRGAINIGQGTAFTDPVKQAAEMKQTVVLHDVGDEGGVWEAALGQSFSAVAAVPFVYENDLYGVLVVYTDRQNAFDHEEQRVLRELGANIGYAVNALAVRRQMLLREHQLRRQNERLENFANIVSHDLRNPLNVAQGYVDAIRDTIEEDDVATFAAEVDASLDRMETIIEEVLELARQGQSIDELEVVDLRHTAGEAWGTVETDDAMLDVVDDARILADQNRLVQLFENLFRNAREHGEADTIRVGTLAENGDLDGLYVEDDGPGIPEDEREQVMQMGYTNSEDGTGFGLAIVSEIAGAHGWTPTVTDGSDGGARFEFSGIEQPTE